MVQLVHFDLKSANVLLKVRSCRVAKIADLGLSKYLLERSVLNHTFRVSDPDLPAAMLLIKVMLARHILMSQTLAAGMLAQTRNMMYQACTAAKPHPLIIRCRGHMPIWHLSCSAEPRRH